MASIGAYSLLFSGSRLPFGIFLIVLIILLCTHPSRIRKKFIILIILAIIPILIIILPQNRLAISRYSIFTKDFSIFFDEFLSLRKDAIQSSLALMKYHPLGLYNSDWLVQEKLNDFGYPSHTHSNYIQMYLRYGPLMLIFWYIFIIETVQGFHVRSPYAYIMLYILIGSLFDYYFFVTKAVIIVFAVVFLNRYLISIKTRKESSFERTLN